MAEKKTIGYHLLLSRVALKLISEEHMKIDYETGIKRYFYDRAGEKVAYSEFFNFLESNFVRPPNLSHLVEIIYEEPDTEKVTAIAFNHDNIEAISQTGKSRHSSVRIRENV